MKIAVIFNVLALSKGTDPFRFYPACAPWSDDHSRNANRRPGFL